MMQCPGCKSEHIRKNGKNRQRKQNYVCVNCDRQFIANYNTHQGYSDEFKRGAIKSFSDVDVIKDPVAIVTR